MSTPVSNHTVSIQQAYSHQMEEANEEPSLSTSSINDNQQVQQIPITESLLKQNQQLIDILNDTRQSLNLLEKEKKEQKVEIERLKESKKKLEQLIFTEKTKNKQLTNQVRELQNNREQSISVVESQNLEGTSSLNNPSSKVTYLVSSAAKWCQENRGLLMAVAMGGGAAACVFLAPHAVAIALGVGCFIKFVDWAFK